MDAKAATASSAAPAPPAWRDRVGPMCGITAVAMLVAKPDADAARDALADGGDDKSTKLVDVYSAPVLEAAVAAGYSREGEMFDAGELAELARKVLPSAVQVHGLAWAAETGVEARVASVADALAAGAFVLLAYDAAPNHEPALRSGHAAHWAVVVGVVHVGDSPTYFVTRHGKSSHLALWSAAQLLASNAQLVESHPAKRASGHYAMPADLGDRLASRAVVVSL
ncbi:UPF0692 protein [Thecamonas trahens ATCC 50062]|uniref:Actin maturation protease n=1 Tax=Thecamonas trahens ATCC 50062 TaxID=461836 RepID=A0A0L0DQP4_THETB|nr:UPF0692 protein [Thecamonas trahens ATCC 50062]KNC53758.1 UPF0692 protein [Thecamonas trahens ATCC 50062]|eukprot:XP_013754321.1 UPF0692 protein [Thecamonas trahens ATCC 50062]